MERIIIILAGQRFSKSELVEMFDDFASTSPLCVRTEAWQVAEAINEMDAKQIALTLERLRLLEPVRARKQIYDVKRSGRCHPDWEGERSRNSTLPINTAQRNDTITSALIRAIAKEVLRNA